MENAEAWVAEFVMIAICNGGKGDTLGFGTVNVTFQACEGGLQAVHGRMDLPDRPESSRGIDSRVRERIGL